MAVTQILSPTAGDSVRDLIRKVANNSAYALENGVGGGSGTGATLGDINGRITGLTGGGSTKLDGVATAAKTAGYIIVLVVSGSAQIWQLQAGTDAEDGAYVVRPDDYNAGTNAKIWVRLL